MSTEYLEVFDIIEETEDRNFTFDNYREGERDILAPALAKKGYHVQRWYDAEKDSFGPLVRGAEAIGPNGQPVKLFYS